VEIRIEEAERACTASRVRELLLPLLGSLPAEDRRLLRLSFFEGLSMSTISRALHRPQRELYTARDRCLKTIRRSLDEAGVRSDQIRELIGHLQGSLGLEAQLVKTSC
jgi:DNA-directed RNA polymerase specialized sigma24 family protein